MLMSLVVLIAFWDAITMVFHLFCVINKAISAKPVLYAPEVLVDIVLS